MKTGKINIPLLSISAAMHLMVDGICVCCLYLMAMNLPLAHIMAVFITYNTMAFLTQPLTGLYIDKVGNSHWPLITATGLLGVGAAVVYCLISISSLQQTAAGPFAVACIIGAGNSLFHVWGGKQTILKDGNDPRALGVFVSTGAFGLSLSYVFYSWTLLIIYLFAMSAATMGYIMLDPQKKNFAGSEEETAIDGTTEEQTVSLTTAMIALAIIGIALFVFIRSFVGEWFSGSIVKDKEIIILLVGFVAMAGKMAGGWMMKIGGLVPSLCVMIAATLICLAFKGQGNTVNFIGLFMINCTMPVTLYLANYVLKGREALAFGILAAALMPGYFLSQLMS